MKYSTLCIQLANKCYAGSILETMSLWTRLSYPSFAHPYPLPACNRNRVLLPSVLVAEVSQPSFGVGYEVGRAVELRKPVLCIYTSSPQISE